MISKNTLKYIKSLQLKKNRKIERAFLVEGAKSVTELLNSEFSVRTVFGTSLFLKEQKDFLTDNKIAFNEASEQELAAVGSFKSNNTVIAIAEIKPNLPLTIQNEFAIALDNVNDPGNLGTIIRVADWYGIKKIICSATCADLYNPKVIAASMGSFTRVALFYTDLGAYLKTCSMPVYGAFLDGEDVHTCIFKKEGLLLMGSESHGISPELAGYVDTRINIPAYGQAESLNVAIATAIICDNYKRSGS